MDRIDLRVPDHLAGLRLDQALAELLPDYSRSQLQTLIKEDAIRVDGRPARPRDRLLGGELIQGQWQPQVRSEDRPQDIPLDIRFEDDEILVINKPAGMVVHPAAGNPEGTLLNALLHHAPQVAQLPRAGLVHRLDKDTSGLLVVAKTVKARNRLVEQLQARSMGREYQAVAVGAMAAGGTVEAPIGRHPGDRKRMAVTPGGKPAVTHYRVIRRFRAHTHVRVNLETGRTHQIRVHLAHIQYPLLGDPVYGGRLKIPPGMREEQAEVLRRFARQALHAARLTLVHPTREETLQWQAELPADLVELLAVLEADAEAHHD